MLPEREIEEYWRRLIVKLIKEAGTMIRKETVKRQALTAEVNLGYAESLRKHIMDDINHVLKPLEDLAKESYERFVRKEDISKIVEDIFTRGLATTIISGFLRPPQVITSHINEVNNFVNSVVNKVIEELNKEGIFLPPLATVSLQQADILSLSLALRQALEVMDKSIGIFKGLIEAKN
jgi:hypothetical protein